MCDTFVLTGRAEGIGSDSPFSCQTYKWNLALSLIEDKTKEILPLQLATQKGGGSLEGDF